MVFPSFSGDEEAAVQIPLVVGVSVAMMKRYKMIGVLGGYDPRLVEKWVAAAPGNRC